MKRAVNTSWKFWIAGSFLTFLSIFSPSRGNADCFTLGCLASAPIGFNLTLEHEAEGSAYNLTWTAVEPSTDIATVIYYVFNDFGLVTPDFSSAGNAIAAMEDTSVTLDVGYGSQSFIVISSDTFTHELKKSNVSRHNFIHNLSLEGITRTDGDGTQRGVDQRWTFGYSLDKDAFFTAQIFRRDAVFATDANGFQTTVATPIKTLVEYTPRSREMAEHNIANSETWDSRSSSGVIVSNDIYYLYMAANDVTDTLVGTLLLTVPVDIIRIMNLTATGITATQPTSTITYDITGDANVRILIAQPGSGFTVDSNGDIQPVNRTTGLVDDNLIVSTFTFQRKAGSISEAWDGISSTGTVMPSGVYGLGISASDAYGNHAIDSSGNDAAIFTTITLERRVSSGGGTTSDTTPPTLSSISPADGATVTGTLSTMTVTLADTQSALNLTGTQISITDPNNTAVTGTVSNDGQDTITITFSPALTTGGTYNVTIIALDISGNSATLTSEFSISNQLSASEFSNSVVLFPNPAKSGDVTFQYNLAVDATIEVSIFNVLGERVYSKSFSDSQGTVTHTWDRRNDGGEPVGSGLYLARFKATSSGNDIKAVKKLVIVQ